MVRAPSDGCWALHDDHRQRRSGVAGTPREPGFERPVSVQTMSSVTNASPRDPARYLGAPGASIRSVTAAIAPAHTGCALVVTDDRRLLGTISDGDLRRAILEGFDLAR